MGLIHIVSRYFFQRIPLTLFTILSIWYGLFLLPWISWNVLVFPVCIILLVLFQLRLFDDLMQYQYDLGKPNRDYTQTIIRKKLWVIWLVFSCLLFMLVFWLNPKIGLVYGWLLLINWINYQFLLDRWEWRVYLPLFKYPVIYLVFFQNYVELGEINDNVSLMLFRIILAISVLIGFILLERFSEKSNQLKYAAYAFLIIIGGVSFFLGTQISVEV